MGNASFREMRILFVSHAPLQKELGASKVVIELAEEMQRLGWACHLTSLMELVPGPIRGGSDIYAVALREHLRRHASEYDVVDYDHAYLPYPRSDFSPKTLFVARSVLLAHHLAALRLSSDTSLTNRLRALVAGKRGRIPLQDVVGRAQKTIREADLVNVANHGDEATLVRGGVSKDKIVVLPYGLSRERRLLFDQPTTTVRDDARIAFVGTFDPRKGAGDLPEIVSAILSELPHASFCLLGTGVPKAEVLARFPSRVRGRIEVIPQYPAGTLHELLAPCSMGIFPSYLEGFGFAILEMLAAGLPVIAYDVPGPPMMLPREYLVSVGDRAEMVRRLVRLAKNGERLAAARDWAKRRSRDFDWASIAQKTADAYATKWRQKDEEVSIHAQPVG
jgi:glycosyltransferase involved in cell wall biosynthesis